MSQGSAGSSRLDVTRIRKDFPILSREVRGTRLVYLDSANTSQKPQAVLDAMDRYYELSNANVHRGTYLIAQEATEALEGAPKPFAASMSPAMPYFQRHGMLRFGRDVVAGL